MSAVNSKDTENAVNNSERRRRAKGRSESGSFVSIPHIILRSDEYARLSSQGVKLLLDLLAQYRGVNNGDLAATWSMMEKRGWKSRGTLHRAVNELLSNGWIIKTRPGGKHKPTLYGVSFRNIDECDGKLDIGSTITASNSWKDKNFPTPHGGTLTLIGGKDGDTLHNS